MTLVSVPHALPPLPYPYGALEPTIDELTMRIHHDQHHGGYVAGLNAALEGTAWADRPDLDPHANGGQAPTAAKASAGERTAMSAPVPVDAG